MPGTNVARRLQPEHPLVFNFSGDRTPSLLKHWKSAWASMLREVDDMETHKESWFNVVISPSLDDGSIFGNCATQRGVEEDWKQLKQQRALKEMTVEMNAELPYVVMPIPGGPLY